MLQFLIKANLRIATFILSWCMHIQNSITRMTLYCYVRLSFINQFCPLNSWSASLMYDDSHSHLHIKMCTRPLVPCHPCLNWHLVLPLNITFTSLIRLLQFSVTWPSIQSSKSHVHFTFLRSFQGIRSSSRVCV